MTTATRVSLQEFLARPDIDEARLELIDGEVVEKPMPNWGHGRIAYLVARALDSLGYPSVEPRAIIPGGPDRDGSSPIPDMAFYLEEPPDEREWMTRPPDIAVEVLSPGQSRTEMRAKVDLYRVFGIRSVWVIDPERRSIDIYEDGSRSTYTGDDPIHCTVVPGLSLTVSGLFASIARKGTPPA
jgi:Uma2 family endonuclease